MTQIHIKKLHEAAVIPSFAHATDAGMDLCTIEAIEVLPGARVQVKTGIAMAIPDGYVGLIWDKSGLSHKSGLKTLGGVIDAGYRGEVMVGLVNTSDVAYRFEVGQKVAQILIQKIEHPDIVVTDDLDTTARGEGGFGSTGK